MHASAKRIRKINTNENSKFGSKFPNLNIMQIIKIAMRLKMNVCVAQTKKWIISPRPMIRIISFRRTSFSHTIFFAKSAEGIIHERMRKRDRNTVTLNLQIYVVG